MRISDWSSECALPILILWRIRQVVPAALYQLIAVRGTEWDAPLMGEPYGNAPLPGPDAVDLRTLPAPENDDDLHIFNPHPRSEEHTSELQSLMRISYAVFCLKKKK